MYVQLSQLSLYMYIHVHVVTHYKLSIKMRMSYQTGVNLFTADINQPFNEPFKVWLLCNSYLKTSHINLFI